MRFADFPFLRYLPFLIAGVLLSHVELAIPFLILYFFIAVFWTGYLVLVARKVGSGQLIPAFIGYLMLFLLGYLFSEIQKERFKDAVDPNLAKAQSYLARVEKHDLEKPNSFENLLEVIAVRDSLGWKKSKGKVLIYHNGKLPFVPGQVILVEKSPEKIPSPIFPNEFDYSGFLARKGIHFRQFIGEKFVLIDSSEVDHPKYWLSNFRKELVGVVQTKVPDPESRQIAAALLLGQKENLDREIKNAYDETGTMHILAVSGLHVGIIYAILLFPLKGLRLRSKQKKGYLFAVIVLIWTYAVLTGFSPSVVRAATMFSLFTAGQMRERKPSSFNILAFSAMIMIVINPDVIFEVGFQLSYVAVAGILLIQPLIARFWIPPNVVLEYFWQLTAVSIAAQLATFPLSVYYFHIFPSYFLVANLIIIPLSFLVMQFGIPFLVLSWVPILGDGLGWIVSELISWQNGITRAIQLFPGGNMERLTITFAGMLLVWGILIFWANWELGNRKKLVYSSICLFLIWSVDRLGGELSRPAQELMVYSAEKGTLLDFRIGHRNFSWNENFPTDRIGFSIDPNRIALKHPQVPVSAVAYKTDSVLYFPIFDFSYNPTSQTIHWISAKPKSVREFSFSKFKELPNSDSLLIKSGAFQLVF
jgi:competence protein ComEC